MKDYSLRNEKSKLIHATALSLHNHITELFENGYDQGYEDGKKESCDCKDNMDAEYNRGLNDAWEAAKWLYNTQVDFVEDMFNCEYWEIYSRFTAQKVVHKIKEYKDKQKQDAEIQVGDEVIVQEDRIGFVTGYDVFLDRVYVATKDGWSDAFGRSFVKKTGRHFPEIAEVLAEMRGERE